MATSDCNSYSVIRGFQSLAMDTCPARKRGIALKYDIISSLAAAGIPSLNQKKLRRLPHVFCRVLELPFNSEVPVAVEENGECFRFVVRCDEAFTFQEARAEIIEIAPGVIKVVIREANRRLRFSMDELELDMWRFRLPSSTLPELSTAIYSDGDLVVIVPKSVHTSDTEEEEEEVKSTLVEAREGYFSERNESGINSGKMDVY